MTRDRRVQAGTDAHYLDADYYDHAYRRRSEDIRFYARLVADKARAVRVLELGAGTGRVTLAMAMANERAEVVGVDRMPEMLARARRRLDKAPTSVRERVRLVRGDMRRVRLGERFDLVVAPFNVFMHLYDRRDFEQAMETVKAHLAPRGRLVFDVLVPSVTELARDPMKTYRSRPVVRPEDKQRYLYGESFEWDPVTQIELITMVFEREGEPESLFITPLAQRQFFPAELEALLHYNGLTVEARYGDFDESPLDVDSDSQIVIARAR